jgi:hypothetical protein
VDFGSGKEIAWLRIDHFAELLDNSPILFTASREWNHTGYVTGAGDNPKRPLGWEGRHMDLRLFGPSYLSAFVWNDEHLSPTEIFEFLTGRILFTHKSPNLQPEETHFEQMMCMAGERLMSAQLQQSKAALESFDPKTCKFLVHASLLSVFIWYMQVC